ncbi:murein L,D-transpeptidase catalytic domain family protein [Candidatus Rhodobacter oscarellae]|uniref:murein L,D-transpeptidase catalytic domain family protein n=1 Tax=Candidatus Rhodobacter oscarellae TaxID=1675527 RepID=UPI001F2F88C9|nr:murein L,D-transpeptidase catalytic domain family protein [Candidatus Rhodobacter lobularis]
MRLGSLRFTLAFVVASGVGPTQAAQDIPRWLQAHVGTGEGQIAPVVLERARALYQTKRRNGDVTNPCYLAMDATRPSAAPNGAPGPRFYVICERQRTFRAVSSGYGNGRKLQRANFSNGRQCAKNFSNAEGSKLTAGGAYVTAETRTSFKGYIGDKVPFYRTFILFDGEGETRNARERAIGGHPAVFVKWQCRYQDPDSPHADKDGYVPYGRLVNYTGGRSNGCTTWSQEVSKEITALVEGNPTTLYIYPEGRDINAVANAARNGRLSAGSGLYWNAACLSAIGAPKFWPKHKLQPIINAWRRSLPKNPPLVLPICN